MPVQAAAAVGVLAEMGQHEPRPDCPPGCSSIVGENGIPQASCSSWAICAGADSGSKGSAFTGVVSLSSNRQRMPLSGPASSTPPGRSARKHSRRMGAPPARDVGYRMEHEAEAPVRKGQGLCYIGLHRLDGVVLPRGGAAFALKLPGGAVQRGTRCARQGKKWASAARRLWQASVRPLAL